MQQKQILLLKEELANATVVCVHAPCVGVGHSRGVALYERKKGWTLVFDCGISGIQARYKQDRRANHFIPLSKITSICSTDESHGGTKSPEITWVRKSRRRFERSVGGRYMISSR